MRTPLLRIGGTAIMLAVLAGCAQAPSDAASPPQAASTAPAATSSAATTTAGEAGAGHVTGMTPDELRASRIIGQTVYGPRDESLGEVDDLIVEPDGRVSSAVLSVGGFLGFGGTRVAVPIDDVKLGKDDHLTVNLTKDQLLDAPKFAYSATRREAASSTLGSGTGLGNAAPALSGSSMPPMR